MRFRVLGAVELVLADGVLSAGAPLQRCVLAALTVDVGRSVDVETLIDRVWGDRPPPRPRATMQTYVTALRRLLERETAIERATLVRADGGYALHADPDQVDLYQFRQLILRGRDDAPERRAALLREALDLWRGEPLAGLPGDWAARQRIGLRQEYVDAVVGWADAELVLDRSAHLAPTLIALADEHPLTESIAAVLMRTYQAVGAAAEALAYYERFRQRLADELGVDPAPELQDLHRGLLRGERVRPARPELPALNLIPPDVFAFTGRDDEIDQLDRLLAAPARQLTAVVISAVSGQPGVGKTALAVHWSHRVASRFPDGVLYADLRGFDPGGAVSVATDVLHTFLSALGPGSGEMPSDLDGRAARYRAVLAGKRVLIVLDNARDAEHVRPLLPGSAGCLVLVTSRDRLAGLAARDGAHRIDLDILTLPDALGLLRTLIGGRVVAEPEAAVRLTEQCGRLPLALRLAAELADRSRTETLAELTAQLDDEQARLAALDADGDPRAAVRAVFSWSYQALPADSARVFRLLGLRSEPHFDVFATAALAGLGLDDARAVLAVIAAGHLIEPVGVDRYRIHDLLRAYALSLVDSMDSDGHRDEARERLFDYYLAATVAALSTLDPIESRRRPPDGVASVTTPDLDSPGAALAWLDLERTTLIAAIIETSKRGHNHDAARLALVLNRYLNLGGHHIEATSVFQHILRAGIDGVDEARSMSVLGLAYQRLAQYERAIPWHEQGLARASALGEPDIECRSLNNLGVCHRRLGDLAAAASYYLRATAISDRIGDTHSTACAWGNLGMVYLDQGEYAQSVDVHVRSLDGFRQLGDRFGEAVQLLNLGLVHTLLGRYDVALDHHRRALVMNRELGNRNAEANALNEMGVVYARQGDYVRAVDHHRRALELHKAIGDPIGSADVLNDLGACFGRQGDYGRAADHHRRALALFRANGRGPGEASSLNGLGEALHGGADPETGAESTLPVPETALAVHEVALSVAKRIPNWYEQARAHRGLARALTAAGRYDEAQPHWNDALDLYQRLGVPEADELRTHLTAAGHRP